MPLAEPTLPNLAIEQLATRARALGVDCETLYGTLRLPSRINRALIHALHGPAIFAPAYFGVDAVQVADEVTAALMHSGAGDVDPDEMALDYIEAIDDADQCIERCLNDIPTHRYSLVGFSIGFDSQKLPSAALAKRLREREPSLHILAGGTGCDGPMGRALLETFREFDGVLQGEADATFLDTLKALHGKIPLSNVPNLIYRERDEIHETSAIESPVVESLPLPDYTAFLDQLARSEYTDGLRVLFFESSRGCWWGDAHQCRFCGIMAIGSTDYRSVSPGEVLETIAELERYDPDILYATDAVLDRGYFRTVLPTLAENRRYKTSPDRPLLFYEIKPPLRRSEVELLADAGIRIVQPGIESFSTRLLRLMRKGSTAIKQVELLKWLKAYEVRPAYGLIAGVPGETEDDYQDSINVMRLIHHLYPPAGVNELALHKFSPYAKDPSAFGIVNIRPFELQRITYRTDDATLSRLCYQLDFDVLGDRHRPPLAAARRSFEAAVLAWREAYEVGGSQLLCAGVEHHEVVVRRAAGRIDFEILDGLEARVARECASVTSLSRLCVLVDEPVDMVLPRIEALCGKGLMLHLDDRYLSLAVPSSHAAAEEGGNLARRVDAAVASMAGEQKC